MWIDYLAGTETEAAGRLVEILDRGYEVGLTGVVYQEVVQGVSSQREFEWMSEYLGSQTFYHPRDPIGNYLEAARTYSNYLRAGITTRSAVDCFIARVAVEHGVALLYDDRDFEKMAGVVPDLILA